MKNRIIRINDIGDIDKSKISVYDLNNRYIDSRGNLYGLKYDRISKKVDIIKLMRTHTEDANQIQHEMIKKKITENRNISQTRKGGIDSTPDFPDEEFISEKKRLNPDTFLESTLSLMKTHSARLRGIISSLTNSNAYPRENKTDNIELMDIFRSIEIDGIQRIEKIINYYVEMSSYPRSISYYQSKLDKKGREMIEKLGGDNDKIMRFVKYYEMLNSTKDLYNIVKTFVNNLADFVTKRNIDSRRVLTTAEKHLLEDAVTSIKTTVDEINRLFDEMKPIEEFILDEANYS